ncbi:MAG: hypothetical protein LBO63_04630 [Oscillospiraceae bacterium]|jgi:predicted RNA-binding Zn-ribbon protein involved in translation (DUF1610 family)|nr:hypothetical protein [Oscillospiraceae bacterium]
MFRNFLQNLFRGRYGPDHLNVALIILVFVLEIIAGFLKIFHLLAIAVLVIAFLRMFSRNIYARRRENDRFLIYWIPIKTKTKKKYRQFRDRKLFNFYKCPSCGVTLRIPKDKERGRIEITCPKCGERFKKKK